jgi:membrane dipeptidase
MKRNRDIDQARRRALGMLGGAALAGALPGAAGDAFAQVGKRTAGPLLMDGHVHIINRVYWEKIDPWQAKDGGWDYARAWAAGVNCIIDNIGTYGYWNYNYTPKQALRLIETFHRYAEGHREKMAVARSVAEARRIVASGRMAVFLGCESGFDHEGDPDVLAAMVRLGLRTVQFATQTGFNAFSDSALAPLQGGQKPEYFNGINQRGRALVAQMNKLGVLIDITHGTEAVHMQLIEASQAPVVASHDTLRAVSGVGLSDEVLKALARKGGLIGIHGGAGAVGKRYRKWAAENPAAAAASGKAVFGMVGHTPGFDRGHGDHGEHIARMDEASAERWRALGEWKEDPAAEPFLPTAEEWAEQVDYVIKTVGADHVAIGLDMVGGRSAIPQTAAGYPVLLAALKRITTPANVRKICGENWFRVLGQARVA